MEPSYASPGTQPPSAPPGLGPECSPKSYGRAVVLSSLLGWCGIQHLYLGRPGLCVLDLALSVSWILAFVLGLTLVGIVLLLFDFGHAFLVTIQLLTGNFRDGQGRIVCYPGQKLGRIDQPNPT